ncbi:MAG: aldo/keto reductase [Synergistaceae bacterium]|jgi:predicted aldo/keto reductase-like oxidoreductase|nr:aldo/keto reductase [Synergistaceae bacterium]
MEKRLFKGIGEEISTLGFGLMRLPLKSSSSRDIDFEMGRRMVDRAIEAGVNYFDTAWIYHEGASELFAGEAMSRHPRGSYHLATKMPVWELASRGDMERVFSEQLRKCRVDCFDFYLLHNIGGDTYDMALKYDVYEFLNKKKKEGYIRFLGFSVHDGPELLEKIANNWKWDFAQIQLNYIDWEALDARRQYEILESRGIPVVVMEPVRGGALANLGHEAEGILKRADPAASQASWAMRYAASLPGVITVLSGMSNPEQLEDNLKTMTNFRPLSDAERATLDEAAKIYRASGTIPCTACRYCMDCPSGVDIPRVFSIYNHYRMVLSSNPGIAGIVFRNNYRTMSDIQRADSCVSCGNCVDLCPQGINIPGFMKEIAEFAAAR